MTFRPFLYNQETKQVRKALQNIFGIGAHFANQICDRVGISNQRIKDLTSRQFEKLENLLTHGYFTGSELQRLIKADQTRLARIKCFRARQLKPNKASLQFKN